MKIQKYKIIITDVRLGADFASTRGSMYVTTFKNATDRTVFQELRVSDRMAISTIQTAEIVPILINAAVDKEWSNIATVRDESSVFKREGLPLMRIIRNAGCVTNKTRKRLIRGIAGY
jgi:hypothetical protein